MKEQTNEKWEELKAVEKRMKEEARLYKQAKKLKLKPCPFCGKKAQIMLNNSFSNRYFVGCVNAGCEVSPRAGYGDGGFVEELPELIEAWNRRPKNE